MTYRIQLKHFPDQELFQHKNFSADVATLDSVRSCATPPYAVLAVCYRW